MTQNQWYSFTSSNFRTLVADAARLTRIRIGGIGWDYTGRADNLVLTLSSGTAPVASFTWFPSSPTVGQSVQVTDTSTGSPTQWFWDFGDGTSSTQQSPTHAFVTSGTRSVILNCSNAYGSSSKSYSLTVTPVVTCAGNRDLPAGYSPGMPVQVAVAVTPSSGTSSYAVEDSPPSGWAVSGIDNGGSWDSINAKVKWGPYFDNMARTLSYSATPLAGASGAKIFSGVVSFDGSSVAVGGSRSISTGSTYAFSMWVPVATHAAGANSSQWCTDLGLLNPTSSTASVEVRWTSSGSTKTNTTTVSPMGQSILTDVVAQLGGSGSGALEVRSDQALTVTSRTYNLVGSGAACYPNGTLGQDYPSFKADDALTVGQSVKLGQLVETSAYRTNIGLVNAGTAPATATVELYTGAGTRLTSYTVTLAPGEWKQENQPFKTKAGQTNLQRGWAQVTVTSGSGVAAFASVIDNVTNDPTTIPMVR